MRLIGFPYTGKDGKLSDKLTDVLCVVSWWPSPDDPQIVPYDSEYAYAEVRKIAPKILVDYFEKRVTLN